MFLSTIFKLISERLRESLKEMLRKLRLKKMQTKNAGNHHAVNNHNKRP